MTSIVNNAAHERQVKPQRPKWAALDQRLTFAAYVAVAFILGWGACAANYQVAKIPQLRADAANLSYLQTHTIPALRRSVIDAEARQCPIR